MDYFIFDVDGTLIDSEKMYWNAFLEVLQEYDYEVTFERFHKSFGKTMQDALNDFEIFNDVPNILKKWKLRLPAYSSSIMLFPGVENMLKKLTSRENVYTCIATSETKAEYQNNMSKLMISQYFNKYTLSSEVEKGKPAPDIIIRSIQKLNALNKQDSIGFNAGIYIGDAYSDLVAAHAAGLQFGLASWSLESKSRNDFSEAEYVFERPTDILNIIL